MRVLEMREGTGVCMGVYTCLLLITFLKDSSSSATGTEVYTIYSDKLTFRILAIVD